MFEYCFFSSIPETRKNIKYIKNVRYGTILRITSEEKTYYTFQRDIHRSSREIKYYGALAFGRFRVISFKSTTPFYIASVELLVDDVPPPLETQLMSQVILNKKASFLFLSFLISKNNIQK